MAAPAKHSEMERDGDIGNVEGEIRIEDCDVGLVLKVKFNLKYFVDGEIVMKETTLKMFLKHSVIIELSA